MSQFKPGEIEAIKLIRTSVGIGLREAYSALQQYRSAEDAIAALRVPKARDSWEQESARDRHQAELYRALRDSGNFRPREDDYGWVANHHGAATPKEMDKAAANLVPRMKPL